MPTAEDEVAKRDAELPAADSWDGSGDGEGDAGVAAGDEDPEGVSAPGVAAFEGVLGDVGVPAADPGADPGATGDGTALDEEEEEA